ncbi:hypothetical protein RF11_09158 [Thelohanellus kitauei]|uniref:Uncharacterized protein n=1 Tax=Thelohanellus kitauei TaxID=669202 RepID=A0A0C2J043_THEKT|nr:hypothetical protein RF11_09158 [Thelohanellus kitauei]
MPSIKKNLTKKLFIKYSTFEHLDRNVSSSIMLSIKVYKGNSLAQQDLLHEAKLTGWRMYCGSEIIKLEKSYIVYDETWHDISILFVIQDLFYDVSETILVKIPIQSWTSTRFAKSQLLNVQFARFRTSVVEFHRKRVRVKDLNCLCLVPTDKRQYRCKIRGEYFSMSEHTHKDLTTDLIVQKLSKYGNEQQLYVVEREFSFLYANECKKISQSGPQS